MQIVPIIYKDIDYSKYSIDTECRIYEYDKEMDINDIIYHSTNGYDYVSLEILQTGDGIIRKKLYRLDFVMVSSFNPGLQNKYDHFNVIHLDGNPKNCHLDNLTCEDDIEEWKVIEHPSEIKRNMYAVSSWGRIKSIATGIIMKPHIDRDGYYRIKFMADTPAGCVHRHVQRIVGMNFIPNDDPNLVTINHIDGDKSNNCVTNLEWHSWLMNNRHAMRMGLNNHKGNPKITCDEVNMIVDMLLDDRYNASPYDVNKAIDHTIHPLINVKTVTAIKCKEKTYCHRCTKYNLREIKFKQCRTPLTDDEFDMIVRLLLSEEHSGRPLSVYKAIDHDKFPNITYSKIAHIKEKSGYRRTGSKYDISKVSFTKYNVGRHK